MTPRSIEPNAHHEAPATAAAPRHGLTGTWMSRWGALAYELLTPAPAQVVAAHSPRTRPFGTGADDDGRAARHAA